MTGAKMQPFWWFLAPPKGEAINNGGFETGDLTGWSSYCAQIDGTNPHSGAYCVKLLGYGCYIMQDNINVLVDNVVTLGFWHRNSLGSLINTTEILVTFTDNTTAATLFGSSTTWGFCDALHILDGHAGKIIKKLRIKSYNGEGVSIWVDDVTLDPKPMERPRND